jgi:hypothetical protein
MFRPLARSHRRPPRRGTSFILIVVSMLTLFAAVGMAYALYAMQEAKLGLARKDQEGGGAGSTQRTPDPTDTINRFFGALIYDTDDTDVFNALRGHSLARSMYGKDNYALFQASGQLYTNPYTSALATPWAGVGTFQDTNSQGARGRQVNHTWMLIKNKPFLIDPEIMSERGFDPKTGAPLPFDPTTDTRPYVSKAAGYSYPDLKDFFLAAIDPADGQVLVQSFYRPWLFGSLDPANGNPTNPTAPTNNWINDVGQTMILRPRPKEHPLFPRVPPNADGSFSGDVQNWPGGYVFGPDANGTNGYHARNDSLWMNMGLPVITLPGNRRVQPLVAPLIVPLNGLFDLGSHGNVFGGGAHLSYAGYGPWEVNLSGVLGSDAQTLVAVRSTSAPALRNGSNTRAYDPYSGTAVPPYAPVPWDSTAPKSLTYPSGGSLAGLPAFAGFQFGNNAVQNHPALFSPTEWADVSGSPRVFPLSDLKRLNRFAFTPEWYTQADVVGVAPSALAPANAGATQFVLPTSPTTVSGYRLDLTHLNRALFTPRSFSLDRPKLVPNFPNRDGTALTLAGLKPGPVNPVQYLGPQNIARGNITDLPTASGAGAARWANALAALGSVNLNRPLADYRDDTTQALGKQTANTPNNLGNQAQADQDRQRLARDIFTRLVAALGAAAIIDPASGTMILPDPTTQMLTPPGGGAPINCAAQYPALRYLAQLAVNIVDYIDNDDISTVFVWNPNPNNGSADFTNPGDVSSRVVFGVERPRLVINEAYSEVVNDPDDPETDPVGLPANAKAHVRFWLELLNPTTATAQPGLPIENGGGVSLKAYQIEIARANRVTGAAGVTWPNPDPMAGSFAGTADIVYSLAATGAVVTPNGGTYNTPNQCVTGMVLVGPPIKGKFAPKKSEYTASEPEWTAPGPVVSGPAAPSPGASSMAYSIPMPDGKSISNAEFKRNVVLLRRLANPYAAGGINTANPYVTVDVMDYVPSFDAVSRAAGQANTRTSRPQGKSANDGTEYDPLGDRFAVGKVQPYAGHALTNQPPASGIGVYNTYTFPTSMVLAQTVPSTTTSVKHSFGRHNGVTTTAPAPGQYPAQTYAAGTLKNGAAPDTIMTPFDWLVHPDRPLVNQIELLQVRDSAPYLVTEQFVLGGGAYGVNYDTGYGRWTTGDGLARALEYLTVKPFTANVAHGGRMPGQINVNAVQDRRVTDGLFDNAAFGPTAWAAWMNAREMNATNPTGVTQRQRPNGTVYDTMSAPGQTVFDANTAGLNRPFMPFGAPVAAPGGGFAYGSGTEDGLLRGSAAGNPPLLYANTTVPHSYLQAEPLRKVLNNTTTVNHTYLVFLTIGYFDLDTTTANPPLPAGVNRLGAEAYLNVPGDMRQKVVAVVDMSNMALQPTVNAPATVQPFFTTLEARADPLPVVPPPAQSPPVLISMGYSGYDNTTDPNNPTLFVAADGQGIAVTTGSQLVIGYGVEQQVVSVTTKPPAAPALKPGQLYVTGLTRTAWPGSSVSNVRPGYPGPQQGFDYTLTQYKPVIPYLERLK